ncbi:MAG: diguanylate cyclase [Lachnospiraceae bacterium]|nr:diguanylate cyclase [Lachnospiraceae bacterium]
MRRDKKPQNRVQVYLTIGIAIILMEIIVFIAIDTSNRRQAYKTSEYMIEQVDSVLAHNGTRVQLLVDALKENYIAKAKAVSYIIDQAPEIENDLTEMSLIAHLMSIDEIHLFDPTGKIYGGTVPAYYGYSFDSGEQMAYFKPMLEDKTLSMCQDVTPNTADNKPMMYAICWNDSGSRITQIGIEPRRLLEEMRSSELSEVISDIPVYDGINILVADRNNGEIYGATVSKYVGKTLFDIGVLKAKLGAEEMVHKAGRIQNRETYISVRSGTQYLIAVLQDRSLVNKDLPLMLLMVFCYLLIAGIVICIVSRKLNDRIVEEKMNANVDVMTGLYNRRAYEEDIRLMDTPEGREQLAYISIDLNGLKETNDQFGHESGDELIIGVARCMGSCFDALGTTYRIGGDEFVALIHAKEQEVRDRMIKFEKETCRWSAEHEWELSTACGVVTTAEFADRSIVELARIADHRMYEQKAAYYRQKGKDRRI